MQWFCFFPFTNLLHVVPVGDDAVFDGILQGEDTSLALGLVSDVRVLLAHTDHHSLVTRSPHDGGEDCSWCVIAGKASLAHPGTVVNDQSGRSVVTHSPIAKRAQEDVYGTNKCGSLWRHTLLYSPEHTCTRIGLLSYPDPP